MIFSYALGVTDASVGGIVMGCLQHFFNLNLLLFLDLHWSDVFHPRLSKKARRNWRAFILLNIVFNAFFVLGACPLLGGDGVFERSGLAVVAGAQRCRCHA